MRSKEMSYQHYQRLSGRSGAFANYLTMKSPKQVCSIHPNLKELKKAERQRNLILHHWGQWSGKLIRMGPKLGNLGYMHICE
jgi:hypothetical protein